MIKIEKKMAIFHFGLQIVDLQRNRKYLISIIIFMNVIVTGASRGIGKAVAEIFAANGHDLFLSSRNEVALYKAMEELSAKYPSITIKAKPFDCSKKEQAIAFGNWCLSYGTPDILVNNAGLYEPGSVSRFAYDLAIKAFDQIKLDKREEKIAGLVLR